MFLTSCSSIKKIETFLVKNIRSGNSIINDSRKSLVNKHHVKLGQKVLTSRWFKVLEAYPNSIYVTTKRSTNSSDAQTWSNNASIVIKAGNGLSGSSFRGFEFGPASCAFTNYLIISS